MLLPRSAGQSSPITIYCWCNLLLQTLLPRAPGSQDGKQAKGVLLDQVKQAVYAAQPADVSLLDLLYSVSLEQVHALGHLLKMHDTLHHVHRLIWHAMCKLHQAVMQTLHLLRPQLA